MRLSESLYSIKSFGQNCIRLDEFNRLVGFISTENSCIPVDARGAKPLDTIEEPHLPFSGRESNRSTDSVLSGHSMYVDLDISSELRNKVKLFLEKNCLVTFKTKYIFSFFLF